MSSFSVLMWMFLPFLSARLNYRGVLNIKWNIIVHISLYSCPNTSPDTCCSLEICNSTIVGLSGGPNVLQLTGKHHDSGGFLCVQTVVLCLGIVLDWNPPNHKWSGHLGKFRNSVLSFQRKVCPYLLWRLLQKIVVQAGFNGKSFSFIFNLKI